LLLLCYYDGKSTFPVDFSIHRKINKNEAKPYGLTKKKLKQQFHKRRLGDSEGYQSAVEVDQSKNDVDKQYGMPYV
jgi:hypothetical protein